MSEQNAFYEAHTRPPQSTLQERSHSSSKVQDYHAPQLEVEAAVLVELKTGSVLLNINGDKPLPPASMVKMMTSYIVAEQIKQRKINWDDIVTIKQNASQSKGSRIYLAEGDQHTVRELMIAMTIGSSNDATVALAEHIAGAEAQFVQMMNNEALRMGMKNTHFINSTGLDRGDMPPKYVSPGNKETVMSAMDAAILCKHIVQDHPDYAQYTSLQSYKFRERDKKPIVNLNWMLEANKDVVNFKKYAYPGLSGMKTGHTDSAGYCFTGIATQKNMSLISVVMGTKTEQSRFVETKKVLDYGFSHFELKQYINEKAIVPQIKFVPIKNGKSLNVPVVIAESVYFIIPKGTAIGNVSCKALIKNQKHLMAPLKKGDQVGELTFTYQPSGQLPQQKKVGLITAEPIEEGSAIRLFFRNIAQFFFNIIGKLF